MAPGEEESRIPPIGPFPKAPRGHPEEPMRVTRSTSGPWLVAAWALGGLGIAALGLLVLIVLTAPRP